MIQLLVWFLAAIVLLAPTTSEACMGGFPIPGECTMTLLKSLGDEVHKHRDETEAMSQHVLMGNDLYVDLVRNYPDFSNTSRAASYIKDSARRKQYEAQEPVEVAQEIENLRPVLKPNEWRAAVKLWAKYLHETAEAYDGYDVGRFCTAKKQASGLALDAALTTSVVVFPVLAAANSSETSAKGFAMAAGLTLGSAIALTADVVTFVPNVIASHVGPIRTDIHLKRSAHAYSEFAKLADAYRKKYRASIPDGH